LSALIDSNVYVYNAIEDSEYHLKSREILDSLSKWFISTITFHEIIWTLMELLDRNATLSYVKSLLSHRKIEIVLVEKRDILWSLENISRENISLARYNDKIILSLAKRLNVPLLSFDKQLLSQAARKGIPIINPYSL